MYRFRTRARRRHTLCAPKTLALTVLVGLGAVLSGCGDDTSTVSPAAPTYSVSASVNGLTGSGLVLNFNGGIVPVTAQGGSAFVQPLAASISSGAPYTTTVKTQPADQVCSISGGTGTMGSANVSSIAVTCTGQPFTLGGTISGLGASTGLVLTNNSDTFSVPANSVSFKMPTPVTFASPYSVKVQSSATGLVCTVSQGSGTMPANNVSNIAVSCSAQTFSLGGSVNGLPVSGLVLANGTDTVTLAANSTQFAFPTGVVYGGSYSVTVKVQPAAYNCTVTNGAGANVTASVGNVSVSCVAGTFTNVYSFGGGVADGAIPEGTLIQANDGNLYGMTSAGGSSGQGTVFKIAPNGTVTILYSFAAGATDGANPLGSLIQASDGNLYGMTSAGGPSNAGTVFKMTPNGTETVLHSFTITDGDEPRGDLIQASDGNFYGITPGGGMNGHGTVFKMTPDGTTTAIHSFNGNSDGSSPTGSLIQANDGNLYGTSVGGGTHGQGIVFKMSLDGTETVLHSFVGGPTEGCYPRGSLIQASDGNLYGMTNGGCTVGLSAVFKMALNGTETILHQFGGPGDGIGAAGYLIQANDGNFYGMTVGGGANHNGTVFQMTPDGTETVLHSFTGGTDGYEPYGSLVQASNGIIYGMTAGEQAAPGLGNVFQID
jgi:uncharacterized repeat protein (TIGR03803 family)